MKMNGAVILVVILIVGTVAWLKTDSPPKKETPTPPVMPTAASEALTPHTSSREPLPRLVELGAGKCKACKEMAPIIEEVKSEYAGKVTVEFIDVIKEADRARSYNWRLIPTQVLLDTHGEEIWRHEGFLSKDQIVSKLAEMGAT